MDMTHATLASEASREKLSRYLETTSPRVAVVGGSNRMGTDFVIRFLDISISLALLLFLLPLLVLVGILVTIQDGGSIFYSQCRVGYRGREFHCFKFRSMLIDADERLENLLRVSAEARAEWARDHKLRNDPRITKFGKFIRKSSLDEFPQLFNVIKGEMSLVGPRPIVKKEVIRYGRSIRHYAKVKPGITGLWQVMGRNDVTYNRRVAMDRLFSKKKSVFLYIYILCMTLPAVLFQRGSY